MESRLLRGRWGHFAGGPCRVDLVGVLLEDNLGPAVKLLHGRGFARLPILRVPIIIQTKRTRGLVDTFDVEVLAGGAPVDGPHPLDIF